MTKSEYILEGFDEAICEHAPDCNLTKEQRQAIVKDLIFGLDMWPEASGELCIPNPLLAEIEEEKKKRLKIESDANKNQREILDAFCYVQGLRPGSLIFSRGRIEVLR